MLNTESLCYTKNPLVLSNSVTLEDTEYIFPLSEETLQEVVGNLACVVK
jgi:hypothetical protein